MTEPAAGRRAASLAIVVVATTAAGWSFTGAFVTAFVWPAVLLGAAVPVVLVWAVGAVSGRSASAPALAGAAGALAASLVAVLLAGGSSGEAARALASSWADLLSRTLPVDGAPTLLVVPALACGVTAASSALLVVRGRSVVLPLVPLLVLVVAARLLGGPSGSPRWAIAAVVGTGFLLAATRVSWRATVRVVPVAVGAVVVGLVLSAAVPVGRLRPPVNLRDRRELTLDELSRTNPLSDARAAANAGGDEVVFTVRLDGPAPLGGALTLVSLDGFDGAAWSSSASFVRTGQTLPEAPQPLAASELLHQVIDVRVDAAPWIPAAARPVRVTPGDDAHDAGEVAVAVDPISGALGVTGGRLPAGASIAVESRVPRVSAADAAAAALPADAGLAALAQLPAGAPLSVASAAQEAMGSAASPFQQASALERWLAGGDFTLDPEAPGGVSFGSLDRFLAEGAVGRRGTEEQFAAAYVVVARSRGIPSRLTVGYRLPDGGRGAGPRTYDVRRGDLAVWPEVAFAGLGWVPFDPVPQPGGASPSRPADDPVGIAKQQAAQLAADPSAPAPPPPANPVLQSRADTTPTGADRTTPWVAMGAIGLAVVLLLIGRAVAPRWRRRARTAARRGVQDPRLRVLGAWHEVIDAVDRARGTRPGIPDPEHVHALTVPEVGTLVRDQWGDAVAEPTIALGRLVNDAVFSPDGADAAHADEAWRVSDRVLAQLRGR